MNKLKNDELRQRIFEILFHCEDEYTLQIVYQFIMNLID